jgi:hypothetical protein
MWWFLFPSGRTGLFPNDRRSFLVKATQARRIWQQGGSASAVLIFTFYDTTGAAFLEKKSKGGKTWKKVKVDHLAPAPMIRWQLPGAGKDGFHPVPTIPSWLPPALTVRWQSVVGTPSEQGTVGQFPRTSRSGGYQSCNLLK